MFAAGKGGEKSDFMLKQVLWVLPGDWSALLSLMQANEEDVRRIEAPTASFQTHYSPSALLRLLRQHMPCTGREAAYTEFLTDHKPWREAREVRESERDEGGGEGWRRVGGRADGYRCE